MQFSCPPTRPDHTPFIVEPSAQGGLFSSFEVVVRWSSKSSAASVGLAGTVGRGEDIQNPQGVRMCSASDCIIKLA